MNKQAYLESLEKQLRAARVSETTEIVAEYEEHFACKLRDGYAEEEIAARLEKPELLAAQFKAAGQPAAGNRIREAVVRTGLIALDVAATPCGVALYAFSFALAAIALAFLALGISLAVGETLRFGIVPYLPLLGRLFVAVCALSLALLSAAGCVYYSLFIRQAMRAYAHWHGSVWTGRKRPALPLYPQMGNALRRGLRRATLLSVLTAAASCIIGYAILAISAGAFEFWHVWGWFV